MAMAPAMRVSCKDLHHESKDAEYKPAKVECVAHFIECQQDQWEPGHDVEMWQMPTVDA